MFRYIIFLQIYNDELFTYKDFIILIVSAIILIIINFIVSIDYNSLIRNLEIQKKDLEENQKKEGKKNHD